MGKKSVSDLAIDNMQEQIRVLQLAIAHLQEQQRKKTSAPRKPVAVENAGEGHR